MNVYVATFEKDTSQYNKLLKVTGNKDVWFLDQYIQHVGMTKDDILKIELGESFNIWDEQWEVGAIDASSGENVVSSVRIRSKNFIPVSPNTLYYPYQFNDTASFIMCWYDKNKNFISSNWYTFSSYQIRTPENCYYIRFSTAVAYGATYKNDICINLSKTDTTVWPHNGEYVAYQGKINTSTKSFPKYLIAKQTFIAKPEYPIFADKNGMNERLKYVTRGSNVENNLICWTENNQLKASVGTTNTEYGLKLANNKIMWVIFKNNIAYLSPKSSNGKFYPAQSFDVFTNVHHEEASLTPLVIDDIEVGKTVFNYTDIFNYYSSQSENNKWRNVVELKDMYDNTQYLSYISDDQKTSLESIVRGMLGAGVIHMNVENPVHLYFTYYDPNEEEYITVDYTFGYYQIIDTTADPEEEIENHTFELVFNTEVISPPDIFYNFYCSNANEHIYTKFDKTIRDYPTLDWDANGGNFIENEYIRPIDNANGSDFSYYDFIPKGVVNDYISLQWMDGYNTVGSFSLVLADTPENRDIFKQNRYVMIEKSDKVMIIEKVKFNANLRSDGYILEVSGRSLESILERRVAFPGIGLNDTTCKSSKGLIHALYLLVHNYFIDPFSIAQQSSDGETFFYYPERKVPFMDDTFLDTSDGYYRYDEALKRSFNNSINKSVVKDNLLKIIQEQCQASNLGFKIVPYKTIHGYTWRFILYTGYDRSYSRPKNSGAGDPGLLIFSPKLNNVSAVATTDDLTNYRNVVFCGTEKDADTYIDFTTTTAEGLLPDLKMPKIITGLKEQAIAKISESPPCYTGILYLALAAARTDKDYNATVTNITGLDFLHGSIKIQCLSEFNLAYVDSSTLEQLNSDDISSYTKKGQFYVYNYHIKTELGIGDSWVEVEWQLYYDASDNDGKFKSGSKELIMQSYRIYNSSGVQIQMSDFFAMFSDGWDEDVKMFYVDPRGISNRTVKIGRYVAQNVDQDSYINVVSSGNGWGDDFTYGTIYVDDLLNQNTVKKGTLINGYVKKAQAEQINITYKITYGDDTSGNAKTGTFNLANVNGYNDENSVHVQGFKDSTAYGWLTTNILNQAIQDLNDSKWGDDGLINGVIQNAEKWAVSLWFKTIEQYTRNGNMKRWLCQTYINNSLEIGLDRREVFVEEEKDNSDDWNASAITQWAANTKVIKTDDVDDEDSDEKINERLKESARKQAGDYRKQHDVDADCESEMMEYLGDITQNPNSYGLGDIVQVDDGRGNIDKKIISSVTIADDTSGGLKVVPTFSEYTLIPKDYRQLDWIQVANMILPVEFNKIANASNTIVDGNFKPTNYGGPNQDEMSQNVSPQYITSIYNEIAGKVTEVSLKATYVHDPKDITKPLKENISLISAIGQIELNYSSENNRHGGIYIPMMLCATKNTYLTDFDLRSTERLSSSFRNDYLLCVRLGEFTEYNQTTANDLSYNKFLGLGYKYRPNYYDTHESQGQDTFNNLFYSKTISAFEDQAYDFSINKINESDLRMHGDLPTTISSKKKKVLYSESSVGDDILMNKPQCEKYLLSKWSIGPETDYTLNINGIENSPYELDNGYAILVSPISYLSIAGSTYTLDNTSIYGIYGSGYNKEFAIDDTGGFSIGEKYKAKDVYLYGYKNYGQLYYNYSVPEFKQIEGLSDQIEINTHTYRSNLILGGFAITCYENGELLDNELYFSNNSFGDEGVWTNYDGSHKPPLADEGYGDTENGVRIYSLEVYEYNSSSRLCQYEMKSERFMNNFYGPHEIVDKNDTLFNSENPDVKSRRLVHQYIPVEYIGANQDEVSNEERFGLYDTVEQMYVPVNWKWAMEGSASKNDQATLINYGGYTENI